MNEIRKELTTTVDDVPVLMEIKSLGPSTPEKLYNFISNHLRNDQPKLLESPQKEIPVIEDYEFTNTSSQGEHYSIESSIPEPITVSNPNNDIQFSQNNKKAEIEQQLKKENKDPIDLIIEIGNALEELPDDKPWWSSKVVIANILAIVSLIVAYFGLDIEFSEQAYVILPGIISLLNMAMRFFTNTGIESGEGAKPATLVRQYKKDIKSPKRRLKNIKRNYKF